MSARRSKTKFTQIHVSIPLRLLEDYDDLLAHNASRSKAICYLIREYLEGDGTLISEAPSRQLMAALIARPECDDTLKLILLGLLNAQKPDEQSF